MGDFGTTSAWAWTLEYHMHFTSIICIHIERKLHHEKCTNQLVNQSTYARLGCTQGWFAASLFHPASQNIAQVAKISVMKKASGQWEGALSAISSI